MPTAVSVVCAVAGVLATLTMVVFAFAGMPNGSPAQLARIRLFLAVVAAIGVVALVAAVWCMLAGRPWIGAAAGGVPMVVLVVAGIWAFVVE